jgi:hypothetical protein
LFLRGWEPDAKAFWRRFIDQPKCKSGINTMCSKQQQQQESSGISVDLVADHSSKHDEGFMALSSSFCDMCAQEQHR